MYPSIHLATSLAFITFLHLSEGLSLANVNTVAAATNVFKYCFDCLASPVKTRPPLHASHDPSKDKLNLQSILLVTHPKMIN